MSDEIPSEKRCTKCGEVKPLDAFGREKRGKYGRRGECKTCHKIAYGATHKAYYETNADRIRARERARYQEKAEAMRQYTRDYNATHKEAKREYNRAYNAAHAEEKREYNRAYRAANLEELRARDRAYHATHAEARRDYNRQYRADNADRIREQRREYRQKNAARIRERMKAYRTANREYLLERMRERGAIWRAANVEKIRDYMSTHYEANREHILERNKAWRIANPDAANALAQNRRAKVKGNGGKFSSKELKEMRAAQNGVCAYCQRQYDPDALTMDHIIPISRGGRHEAPNICLACPRCNFSKHNKMLEEWTNRWYERDNDEKADV